MAPRNSSSEADANPPGFSSRRPIAPCRISWRRLPNASGSRVSGSSVSSGADQPKPYCQRYPSGSRSNFASDAVSYTHLRAHETRHDLVCRLLLEKKKKKQKKKNKNNKTKKKKKKKKQKKKKN